MRKKSWFFADLFLHFAVLGLLSNLRHSCPAMNKQFGRKMKPMNHTLTSPLCRFAALGVALFVGASSDAGYYTSIYTLNSPYTASSPNVTQVLVNWSTSLTSGMVQQGDLTDWSISLLGGGNLFYTDNVIIGGSVQSNRGVARGIADVLFRFDFATFKPGDFDNMLAGLSLSSATSTAYNIYSYPNSLLGPPYSSLGIWSNGVESTRQLPGYSSVFTIPAPGAFVAVAFAMAIKRRRRN